LDNRTHVFDKATHSWDLQAGTYYDESIGARSNVCIHNGRNGLLVWVMFVVEDNAWSHLAHSMTALTSFGAESVCLRACRAERSIRAIEELAFELREVTTFLAYHFVEAAV
jgi:hypothetical protein